MDGTSANRLMPKSTRKGGHIWWSFVVYQKIILVPSVVQGKPYQGYIKNLKYHKRQYQQFVEKPIFRNKFHISLYRPPLTLQKTVYHLKEKKGVIHLLFPV